jgi:PKD repeat protein
MYGETMQRSNTLKSNHFQNSLAPDRDNPLNPDNHTRSEQNAGIGLGFRAKKSRDRTRKFLRFAIAFASILFFTSIFLAWHVFGRDDYYTVGRGEDILKIATKFNVPPSVLINLNEIKDNAYIREGTKLKIPAEHDIYVVKHGEKLYDIAKNYGVKHYLLSKYNRLLGDRTLKEGDRIFIPRELSDISIASNKIIGLVPFKVSFVVKTNTRDLIKNYSWDMGNGDTSHSQNPIYTYNDKGIYKVALTVLDENNIEIASNTINIDVRKLEKIQFNAPQFIDVYNKGDVISLGAKVIDNQGDPVEFEYQCKVSGDPVLISQIGKTDKFQIIGTGYSMITVEAEGYKHTGYYFVSPVPSVQVTRSNMEWYKTQFQTGLNGNCGPSCAAMAIAWAKGLDIPVSRIREYIGLPSPDGGVGISSIQSALENYGVKSNIVNVTVPEDIFPIIDRGHIAIILIDRGSVEIGEGNLRTNLFGRYYNDAGMHYVIVKGYSKDRKHYIVYDPIPADWWMNSFRYNDGESMIGKNRYYSTRNVWATLNRSVVEIIND